MKEIWRGRQWRVLENGDIEEIENPAKPYPDYEIGALDLTLGIDDDAGLPWPLQMAGKRWVDIDDFCLAFRHACVAAGLEVKNLDKLCQTAQEMNSR